MLPSVTPWITDGPVWCRINGHDVQTAEFLLQPHQRVIAQPNTFLCGVGVEALDITWGRRLLDPILRRWSGEAAVLQEIVAGDAPARVVLGAQEDGRVGRIVRIPIREGRSIICQRGAYLAHTGAIDINIVFTKRLRAGLLGGQGFVFQRLSGDGDVFLHAQGSVVDWLLPDERIARVSTHNILAFADTVKYDVQMAGGFMTTLFGQQDLLLSQLQGPGRVIVQSLDHRALSDGATRRTLWPRKTAAAGEQIAAPTSQA